jgi:hypothetical protein
MHARMFTYTQPSVHATSTALPLPPLPQLMGSFKDYTFMVPRQQLQKGQAYTGSSTR